MHAHAEARRHLEKRDSRKRGFAGRGSGATFYRVRVDTGQPPRSLRWGESPCSRRPGSDPLASCSTGWEAVDGPMQGIDCSLTEPANTKLSSRRRHGQIWVDNLENTLGSWARSRGARPSYQALLLLYQAAPGAPLAAARVPRRPWTRRLRRRSPADRPRGGKRRGLRRVFKVVHTTHNGNPAGLAQLP